MSEVYDRYVDTAGNYHYADVETGHHVIPNTAVGNFPRPRLIKTNADRIRNMTDEELGKLLNKFGHCPLSRIEDDCRSFDRCRDCWIDWVKEEVKHESN